MPKFGNEFRKPVWFDDCESDDELYGGNSSRKAFGFQVFTNPLEMQKHFEQQVDEMMRALHQFEGECVYAKRVEKVKRAIRISSNISLLHSNFGYLRTFRVVIDIRIVMKNNFSLARLFRNKNRLSSNTHFRQQFQATTTPCSTTTHAKTI